MAWSDPSGRDDGSKDLSPTQRLGSNQGRWPDEENDDGGPSGRIGTGPNRRPTQHQENVGSLLSGAVKLLTEGDDGHAAVRLIAINRTLRDEVERVAPVLAERSRAAAPEELMKRLVENAAPLGVPNRAPEEWATIFGVYLDALAVLPAEAIDEAFARWNRAELYPKEPGRHAFYPKPAELFTLAQPTHLRLRQAAWRAQRALEYVDRLPPQALTPEQVAQRRGGRDCGRSAGREREGDLGQAEGGCARSAPRDAAADGRAVAEREFHRRTIARRRSDGQAPETCAWTQAGPTFR